MSAIKITFGKAWDSEFAPLVYRFQGTPFELKSIFNNITRNHKSARSAKHRFYWNADHKFWWTESSVSKDEAVRMFNYHGEHIYTR